MRLEREREVVAEEREALLAKLKRRWGLGVAYFFSLYFFNARDIGLLTGGRSGPLHESVD